MDERIGIYLKKSYVNVGTALILLRIEGQSTG
jgi:hypothetical protein